MRFRCPTCRTESFSTRQRVWANAILPLKCAACGELAAPSWWSAFASISLPFILIFGLWFALTARAWWPILLTIGFIGMVLYVDFRYLPLARISSREVTVHRLLGVFVIAFLVAGALLATLGHHVGL